MHDGDIAPVLSTLFGFHDGEPLPTTHVKADRQWHTSRMMPMGGRIIFERLRCEGCEEDTFVRVNINDGVVSIPGCDPGSSLCPLSQFVDRVRKRQAGAGDFREVCGLDSGMPSRITFLHQ